MLDMWVFINVIDTLRIKERRAAFNTVNLISLFEEKFCEVGTILARHACNECFFHYLGFSVGAVISRLIRKFIRF
jgi:hypothetical protein